METTRPAALSRRAALTGLGAGGLGLALAARGLTAAAQEASPAAGDVEALGRRYVEDLLNRADQAAVDELIAPDFVLHLNATTIPGIEGFKGFLAGLHEGFPDVRYEIQDLAVDGDRAIVRWVVGGTHRGVFNGIPATGKSISDVPGISWLRIAGGKIAEAWVVVDTLTLLTQIGVIPGGEPEATPAASPAA
jgi:steroid delta-isomerase-like uncharacterized protein